jgi:HAD superfamily hydrolase (TIGR01509 family)
LVEITEHGIKENLEDNMKVKGIIFDLDGTLIDSNAVWSNVDDIFLKQRGFEVPDDYNEAISVCGFYQAAVYTIERFGLMDMPVEVIAEWNKIALDLYKNNVVLKPYVLEYLEHCRMAGLKMAVATASPPEVVEAVLKSNGIFDYFDVVVSVGGEIRGKDYPDIYIEAARRLHESPQSCIVFEDVAKAAASAKAAGAYVCGIFDEAMRCKLDALKVVSDVYIENFSEAPRFNVGKACINI